ncbi:carbohydrate esterase family 16 protein [Aaosphaeria arxii CBS 175.79]|uniref:Carbohydrate esterase family 16 protein n=1 Tax=Aaosphaeria arxii CBS 175.79 TaxID=1450172 RepID=A0A6A5XH53_9PLEO|nr:carbohydrate esterase family 16 protein [Aaosphaeria arxii CBS 175.79]KAF2012528.1 carbohydrate esterase family 16 protein [Aaosphaeria arxii CBS 175.79]
MGFSRLVMGVSLAWTALQSLPVALAIPHFISFGDSYSQTGFDINLSKPSASNPFGNPAYPGYTSSGGPNWIGYLVTTYNSSLLYSYNFAYGGATVNASLVKPYKPEVKSLIDQVKQFSSSSLATNPPWTPKESLFGIWMGVNDVGNSYGQNDSVLLGKILDDYFGQVEILYRAGARNFVFLSVPPINKSPLMLGQSKQAQELEAKYIVQFNDALANRTGSFKARHEDSRAVVVDSQAPFNAAINDPKKYGSKDATCFNSDGKSCLWFNDYHPGLAIHKLVAEAVVRAWNGPPFKAVRVYSS